MPALMVVINGSAEPLAKELKAVERMARDAGVNIQRNISGGGGGHGGIKAGAMRETLVLMREIGRGNWSRVPGSFTILLDRLGFLKYIVKENVSAAMLLAQAHQKEAQSAALAALASTRKAAASTAALYAEGGETEATLAAAVADEEKAAADITVARSAQTKALASAQAAEAAAAEGGAATFALGPLGWIAAALIAVGVAAYFVVKHLREVNEETKNLHDLMDTTTMKFSDQQEALKKAANDAQEFADWLDALSDSQETLADKTEEALKAMREQAKFEKELATNNHASKKELAQMEIDEAQKELTYVKAAAIVAKKQLLSDQLSAKHAENELQEHDEKARDLGKQVTEASEIVRQIEEKKAGASRFEPASLEERMRNPYAPGRARAANDDDVFSGLKVGKNSYPAMSLNQAKANLAELAAQDTQSIKDRKKLSDALKRSEKLTDKDNEEFNKRTKQATELSNSLNLKKKYLPEIAESGPHHMVHGSLTNNQRLGAYSGASALIEVNKSSLRELRAIHTTLQRRGAAGPVGTTERRGRH